MSSMVVAAARALGMTSGTAWSDFIFARGKGTAGNRIVTKRWLPRDWGKPSIAKKERNYNEDHRSKLRHIHFGKLSADCAPRAGLSFIRLGLSAALSLILLVGSQKVGLAAA